MNSYFKALPRNGSMRPQPIAPPTARIAALVPSGGSPVGGSRPPIFLDRDTEIRRTRKTTVNAKSATLDAKIRELIALGVAVTLRCDGSINAHTDAAIKAGASKEDIVDALGVAVMVNAGAAMVYSARSIDAYESKKERKP